jgi:hypothetical protein
MRSEEHSRWQPDTAPTLREVDTNTEDHREQRISCRRTREAFASLSINSPNHHKSPHPISSLTSTNTPSPAPPPSASTTNQPTSLHSPPPHPPIPPQPHPHPQQPASAPANGSPKSQSATATNRANSASCRQPGTANWDRSYLIVIMILEDIFGRGSVRRGW